MRNEAYEIIALICFIVAGLFYLASALLSRDMLVTAGTFVWLAACFVWMVPAFRRLRETRRQLSAPGTGGGARSERTP